MVNCKDASIKSLIQSKDGVHLTAYLKWKPEPAARRAQLNEVLATAEELIRPTMTPENAERFLRPVRLLAQDERFLNRLNGNFGIFRTKDLFRILTIPVDIDEFCVVATSFHVKPLLRWLQLNKEFLLLGVEPGSASLYHGSLTSFSFVDAAIIPNLAEASQWLSDWIHQSTRMNRPRLFLAGDPELTAPLVRDLKYSNFHRMPITSRFLRADVPNLCDAIRSVLSADAKRVIRDALVEFHVAEDAKLVKRNIFQIARAVFQGRVKKLLVADGIQIFGKIDPATGGLAIHPVELDHEDDDILDDLAQEVIRQGGEVVVARRDEIPKGVPAMAIVDRPANDAAARLWA